MLRGWRSSADDQTGEGRSWVNLGLTCDQACFFPGERERKRKDRRLTWGGKCRNPGNEVGAG